MAELPTFWALAEQWESDFRETPGSDMDLISKSCALELKDLVRYHIEALDRIEGEKLSAEAVLLTILGVPTSPPEGAK